VTARSLSNQELLDEVERRIERRRELGRLCGQILATLTIQRNKQPLTEAGVNLDHMIGSWEQRLGQLETEEAAAAGGVRASCPICGCCASGPDGACMRCCGLTLCRGCGKPLDPGLTTVADGCPCNSPRGVNHGLVPSHVCTCTVCDPAQTGSARGGSQ